MATYIYYGTGNNAGGFSGVTTGSGPPETFCDVSSGDVCIRWSSALSSTQAAASGASGEVQYISDIFSQAGAGMGVGFRDAFLLSGSSVRQPTPYISVSEDPVHGGMKQTQNTSISIAGQLTGRGYNELMSYEDQVIKNFHGQFEPFVIVEDGEVVFARDYVKVISINFDTSKHIGVVDYSIELSAVNFSQVPKMEDRYVTDTKDNISFGDNGDGTATMSHSVSAKGVVTSSSNYGSAFTNAEKWVTARQGWDKQVYPTYVQMAANPVLVGKSESRNVLGGSYSITEDYLYNTVREGAMEDVVNSRNEQGEHPTFSKPITTVDVSHSASVDGDFNEVSLSVNLKGGQNYTVDQLREYIKTDQYWLPGLASNDYKSLSELATGLAPEWVKAEINRHPVSISIDEPVTDGTAERSSELNLKAVFSTEGLFGDDEDSLGLSAGNNIVLPARYANAQVAEDTSMAYLDYSVDYNLDAITNIATYSLNGKIVTTNTDRRESQYHSEALLTWAKDTYGGLEAWLYKKVNLFQRGYTFVLRDCWPINPTADSLNVTKNAFNGEYQVTASFNDNDFIKSDSLTNSALKNLKWSIDVQPSLPAYERVPSMNVNGMNLIYDINTIKREKIGVTLNAEYYREVSDGLTKAMEDVVEYNYSDFFYLNGGVISCYKELCAQVGYLDSDKKIMMQSEGMVQDEVAGTVNYKVSYTQEASTFSIPKAKTRIKGPYVN